MAAVKIFKDGEAAKISYLHNAQGQRVFKGEPIAEQTLPNETALGTRFIDWLKKNFSWLYATAQANTSIGAAYLYGGDNEIPVYALLAEYDNGSAKGAGRTEYIYLPTEDGAAALVGLYRGGKFFAIHTDHLGTPRLMTNEANTPVWQRPYSAFGMTMPTGVLKVTQKPKAAIINKPVPLKATNPAQELNIRESSQYEDDETGMRYNLNRTLMQGYVYIQADPIGLAGGWNRYAYVEGNPLSFTDPRGLDPTGQAIGGAIGTWGGRVVGGAIGTAIEPGGGTVVGSIAGGVVGKRVGGAIGSAIGDMCKSGDPCKELNDDVQRAKDNVGKFKPAACAPGMSRWDLQQRRSAWLEEATARAKRDQTCWAGGDAGHQQAQASAWSHVGQCSRLLQ